MRGNGMTLEIIVNWKDKTCNNDMAHEGNNYFATLGVVTTISRAVEGVLASKTCTSSCSDFSPRQEKLDPRDDPVLVNGKVTHNRCAHRKILTPKKLVKATHPSGRAGLKKQKGVRICSKLA